MRRFWFLCAIGGIFFLASIVRLYHLSSPVADWHSWRQADTAAVARNFLKFGLNPLYPRYDDLSNIQSGKDNPMGWRMVEFPLYQTVAVVAYKAVPRLPIEIWLRIVSILSSAGTAVVLTLLVSKLSGRLTGLLTGFVYAVLPYSIYYGRTILPDVPMVFLGVTSVWMAYEYSERVGKRETAASMLWLLGSAVFAALTLLVKPVGGFLLLPVGIVFLEHFERSIFWVVKAVIYGIVALVPLFLWRRWILQFPEGIAVYDWLFNGGNIRFKGAWFYWLFSQRIGELILGYWGLVFLGTGLVSSARGRELRFMLGWIGSLILYFSVIARGNVQHDYYQILIMPIISFIVARGMTFLLKGHPGMNKIASWAVLAVSFAFLMSFSWYTIRTYYWINHPEIVEAGQAADKLLPPNAKVIAPYNGDTTFLYQINRQGWPLGFDIDKKIQAGAQFYVTVSPKDSDWETRDLAQKYTVLVRNDTYAIIDLQKPQPLK